MRDVNFTPVSPTSVSKQYNLAHRTTHRLHLHGLAASAGVRLRAVEWEISAS